MNLPLNIFLFIEDRNVEVESTGRLAEPSEQRFPPWGWKGPGGALWGAGNVLYLDLLVVNGCGHT